MFKRALLPFAVVMLLLAACAKKESVSGDSSGTRLATTSQILKIGNGAEPQDLDPQATTGVPEHNIVRALFEGLVAEDPKDLHPVPGVAESWDVSPDGRIYTFHLRENAKWSNGEPVMADDFIQSYKRMLTPAFAAEYAYLIYDYVVGAREFYDGKLTDFNEVGFKAIDERTLQVTLKNPTPYLLKIIASHTAWMPVPVRVLAKFGPLDRKRTGWTRVGNLVGNGSFVLKEWLPNREIVVVRNPQYWDAGIVKLDEIHFYPTNDISAEERMFRTGQLHITNELPNAKIDVYRRDYAPDLRIEPWLCVYFYPCNVKRPPLDDKRVRKALALAIDRESIVKNITRGGQRPAYAISYPGTAGYTPRAQLTGNIAEAKRLLAEAGYPEGKGCPPIELLYNTSENHRAIAEAIQAMWRRRLGIEVRLINQEWKVYLDSLHTGNYQLARYGWAADYVDPHVFLEIWVTDNGNNNTNWSNAEYDKLFSQALAAKNDAERYEIYQKMDAILVEEVPAIPIYYYTRVHAVSPKVKGYWPTLLDNHPYKYIYLAK